MKSRKTALWALRLAMLSTCFLAVPLAHADTNDEPAYAVKAVAPIYPTLALAANVSGTVVLEAHISSDGKVASVWIIDGPNLLRSAAEIASKRWIFNASDSETIPRKVRLSFTFTIMPEGTARDELLPCFMPPHCVEIKERPIKIVSTLQGDPPHRTVKRRSIIKKRRRGLVQ